VARSDLLRLDGMSAILGSARSEWRRCLCLCSRRGLAAAILGGFGASSRDQFVARIAFAAESGGDEERSRYQRRATWRPLLAEEEWSVEWCWRSMVFGRVV